MPPWYSIGQLHSSFGGRTFREASSFSRDGELRALCEKETRGVTIPFFTGSEFGFGITKKWKIRLRIQGRERNTSKLEVAVAMRLTKFG